MDPTKSSSFCNSFNCHDGASIMLLFVYTLAVVFRFHLLLWLGLVDVFNATFNNISVISCWSVLLVDETGENHRPVANHWHTLSHNAVHLALIEIQTHNISGDSHWFLDVKKMRYIVLLISSFPRLYKESVNRDRFCP
jgi:hypothetical protein